MTITGTIEQAPKDQYYMTDSLKGDIIFRSLCNISWMFGADSNVTSLFRINSTQTSISTSNVLLNSIVGIGNANPMYNLDVNGNVNFTGDIYQNGQVYRNSPWLSNTSNAYITAGLVGIGKSTPAFNLDIVGNAAVPSLYTSNIISYGTTLSNSLNIGTDSNTATINIGGPNTTINLSGILSVLSTNDLYVDDKKITLNYGGAAASASDTGIELYEGGSITGYIKTSSDRNSFLLRTPNATTDMTLKLTNKAVNINNDTLVLDSNNNIGIGLSNPLYKLDVSGTVNATSLLINGSALSTSIGGGFTTNTTNKTYTTCNVGIGTSSPSTALHIRSASTVPLTLDGGAGYTGLQMINNSNTTGAHMGLTWNTGQYSSDATVNDMVIRNTTAKILIQSGNAAAAITVNSNNNVGIGTPNPVYKLDVNGIANIQDKAYITNGLGVGTTSTSEKVHVSGGNIAIVHGGSYGGTASADKWISVGDKTLAGGPQFQMSNYGIGMTWDTDGCFFGLRDYGTDRKDTVVSFGSDSNENLLFMMSSNNEYMRLTGTGRLGIGTNAPISTLDVLGTTRFLGGVSNTADVTMGNMLIRTYNKSLTTGANDYTNICALTGNNGAYTVHVDIIHSESGSSESKSYIIPVKFNMTSSYMRINPIVSSGPYGASNDWALELNTSSATTTLRLVRVSGTYSTANFTCTLRIFQSSANPVSITDSAVTGSAASNGGLLPSTQITQVGGFVGIGTASPLYPLDVAGDVNFTGILRKNGAAYIGSQWSNTTSNVFLLGSNVGIGTTTPAYPLDVNGIINASALYVGGAPYIGSQWSNTTSNMFLLGSNVGIGTTTPSYPLDVNGIINASALYVGGAPYIGSQWVTNSNSTAISIGACNVGINTTTPQKTLHVAGDLQIDSNIYLGNRTWNTQGVLISKKSVGATALNMTSVITSMPGYTYDSNVTLSSLNSNYDVIFNSGTTEIMRCDGANNNVGIGSSSPAVKLDVSGSIASYSVTNKGSLKVTGGTGAGNDTWWVGFGHSNNSSDGNDRVRIGANIANGGAGRLFFTTGTGGGQAERMRIDENGNVGIGTTTPAYKLDVNGIVSSGTAIGTPNGTTNFTQLWPDGAIMAKTNTYLRFGHADTFGTATNWIEKMRIDGNGNVGIGTTSPAYKLDINGTLRASSGAYLYTAAINPANSNVTPLDITANNTNNPVTNGIIVKNYTQTGAAVSNAASVLVLTNTGGGGSPFYAAQTISGGAYSWGIDYAEPTKFKLTSGVDMTGTARITVDASGNVGIGSTTPAYKLDVVGGARVDNTYLGNIGGSLYAGFSHCNCIGSATYALLQQNNGLTYLNCAIGTSISFRESNVEKMTLSGGNLGIGTTSPAYKLDVNGLFRTTGNNGSTMFINEYNGVGADYYWKLATLSVANSYGMDIDGNFSRVDTPSHIRYMLQCFSTGYRPYSETKNDGGTNNGKVLTYYNSTTQKIDVYLFIPSYTYAQFKLNYNFVDSIYPTPTWTATAPVTSGTYTLVHDSETNSTITTLVGGNVGIGSSTPAYKLDVTGQQRVSYNANAGLILTGSNSDINMQFLNTAPGGGNFLVGCGASGSGSPNNFYILNNATSSFLMNITPAGNVGIGTISPGYKLDVFDTSPVIRVCTPSGQYGRLMLGNTNHGIGRGVNISTATDINDVVIHTAGSGSVALCAASGEGLRLNPSGYVGVGTSNPVYKLDVAGNANVSGTVSSGTGFMFRNRIINGDMRIWQRGTTATIGAGTGLSYVSDRFFVSYSITTGGITQSQQTLATTDAPYAQGFKSSLRVTASTACSSYSYIDPMQVIEGNNISDFQWGTSSGTNVTVSFWLKTNIPTSSIISAVLRNGAQNYTYVIPVTVTATGVWQYVTATVPPPPNGSVWNSDNTSGITLFIGGYGASFNTGNANTWQNANYDRTTSSYNTWATLNNYIEFTGVQLEKGTMATPFEFRLYPTELNLCQRYYQRASCVGASSAYMKFGIGACTGTASAVVPLINYIPNVMRIAPTLSFASASLFYLGNASTSVNSLTTDTSSISGCTISVNVGANGTSGTNGCYYLQANNNNSAYIDFSAEL